MKCCRDAIGNTRHFEGPTNSKQKHKVAWSSKNAWSVLVSTPSVTVGVGSSTVQSESAEGGTSPPVASACVAEPIVTNTFETVGPNAAQSAAVYVLEGCSRLIVGGPIAVAKHLSRKECSSGSNPYRRGKGGLNTLKIFKDRRRKAIQDSSVSSIKLMHAGVTNTLPTETALKKGPDQCIY